MNKYALVLPPLVILSVLLGYFGSCLQKEQIYVILLVTAVFVATVEYLLFLNRHKEDTK